MASKSRRIPNVNGASVGPLKNVAYADTSIGLAANAVKSAQSKDRDAVKEILATVKAFIKDSDKHQLYLDAKASDILMGRIASLLDEVKSSFAETELQDIKQQIIDELSGTSISSMLGTIVASQISNFFDDDAKKEDIEDLKAWIKDNVTSKAETRTEKTTKELPTFEDEASEQETKPEETEDNEEGEFKDSTIAKNFDTIQKNIYKQFDDLNKNIGKASGLSEAMRKITSFVSKGFNSTLGAIVKVGKIAGTGVSKVFGAVGKVTGFLGKGLFGAIGGIAASVGLLGKGIKGLAGGIGKLGSKIGGALASPFKKIGGFFSSLNPFKRKKTDENGEKKKQRIKDLLMEKIAKVLEKIWKKIEPFINIALHFMTTMILSVVVPIALIAAKVLLIVGALVLIGIGLYMAYKWITAKVKAFWNYIVSGQMWEDIKAKLLAAWEWLKDFGKWLWDIIYDALYYIFVGMWVDLGKWIWEKLCQFGNWLYDNYIYKYIVYPFKTYVWEPLKKFWNEKVWPMIEPFVKSLTQLKDSIVKAFSAWDTNKSIWENLQNIGGIIKDTIVNWWNNDNPFKPVYEQYIAPFVEDIIAFVKRIRDAFKQWDTSKGIWDNLKNISGIIKDSIAEWWEKSSIKKLWDEKIKPAIDKLREKLGAIEFKIPAIGTIRPFGFLSGKPAFEGALAKAKDKVVGAAKSGWNKFKSAFTGVDNKTLAKPGAAMGKISPEIKSLSTIEDIDKQISKVNAMVEKGSIRTEEGKKIAAKQLEYLSEKRKELAAQQVQQAAKPIQELENMQQKSDMQLSKDSAEVSNAMMQKEEAQQQKDTQQSDQVNEVLKELKMFRSEALKKLDDPAVVPMPIAIPKEQQNSATMNDF